MGVLTIDFLVSFFWLFFIILFLASIVSYRIDYANDERSLIGLRVLMDELAGDINLVLAGGPGHEMTFTLPSNIDGSRYQLWVNSSGVYGIINGRYGKSPIYPCILTDSNGNNRTITLRPGTNYKIKNLKENNRTTIMIEAV